MNFSVLIPYKPDYGVRDYLWSYVKKRYEILMPEVELCIGVEESEPFCRAKAINKAAQKASREIFIITDTDVVFDPQLLKKITLNINLYPWLIPFSNGYRLNDQATQRLLAEGLLSEIRINQADIMYNDDTPGAFMNVMPRAAFEAVAGFDEKFIGWGYEDTAFLKALDTICGRYFRMKGDIYHLWHPEASREYSQRNQDLLKPYQDAYGDVAKMQQLIQDRYSG